MILVVGWKKEAVLAAYPQYPHAVQAEQHGTGHAAVSYTHLMRASFCPPRNDNDMATVFDRAACRVCRGCTLRSSCWERDYVTTFNALNDATQAMLDRGRGEAEDFPGYFSSRCLHFRAFLAAVNEELTALLYRRQSNSRIQDSRAAGCRQYGQLSALLGAAAAELDVYKRQGVLLGQQDLCCHIQHHLSLFFR